MYCFTFPFKKVVFLGKQNKMKGFYNSKEIHTDYYNHHWVYDTTLEPYLHMENYHSKWSLG